MALHEMPAHSCGGTDGAFEVELLGGLEGSLSVFFLVRIVG